MITETEALHLLQDGDLPALMELAATLNARHNSDRVYYNVNRHINPTNICVLSCKFCSFSRKPGEEGAFAHSSAELQRRAQEAYTQGATEVHLVGGLHPRWRYQDMIDIVAGIKDAVPALHIKAYTAVEIEWMARKGRKSIKEVLLDLQRAGLGSLPGGGAEIFHPEVRCRICDTKVDADKWLEIHRTAHDIGLRSNATMLYGHIESYAHRVDHMARLRDLQAETGGFNVFIPLAFQPYGNDMGIERYTCGQDDLKTIVVARIFLHNFKNIKAYWVMLGQEIAQLALTGGANDLDGTVYDEKISRMAGGRAGAAMTKIAITTMISDAGKTAVERDSLYNEIKPPQSEVTTVSSGDDLASSLESKDLPVLAEMLRQDDLTSANLSFSPTVPSAVIQKINVAAVPQLITTLLSLRSIPELAAVQIKSQPDTTIVPFLKTCSLSRLLLGKKIAVIATLDDIPCQKRGDLPAILKVIKPLLIWGVSSLGYLEPDDPRIELIDAELRNYGSIFVRQNFLR